MINSKSFLSKSLKDFSFLFSSNILKKILGFFRELVLAFLFGSSLIYASYLILKTITDFFSQFTFGNALQANLIPRFTKLFKDNTLLNLVDVKKFSNKIFRDLRCKPAGISSLNSSIKSSGINLFDCLTSFLQLLL